MERPPRSSQEARDQVDRPAPTYPEAEGGPVGEAPDVRDSTRTPADAGARVLPQSPASPAAAFGASAPGRGLGRPMAGARQRRERTIGWILLGFSSVSIFTTLGIVAVLLRESYAFFREISPIEFLTGRQWTPLFDPAQFGVLPLLAGSVLIALGAALVALPLGLAAAIYLSEYASLRVRSILKPMLEILAGVPTVVYGYFALTFVTPILQRFFPGTEFFNGGSASLVMGIMIIPLVSSLSEDALSAVPRSLREAAYALGATKFEVAVRTVVPAALSGVLASFILAISRAIGETMIVTIAAGATPRLTLNPLESIQTMTAYIANVSMGEVAHGTVEYRTIFAVGLTLFAMTLLMNVISNLVLARYREVYE